ncbi:MAG: trigger factor [Armatimonadota bacterium]|nr:trigger factor [Armatimonadota bacterium]
MLVKQEQISPCEVELEIEVDAEKVASTFDEVYTQLGKSVTVPGFRKGKAPRAVLESFLDKDVVRERVAQRLVASAYEEALEETKLDPFRPADYELIHLEPNEPMRFKVKVPLEPVVELGDYVGLEVERRVRTVTDEDVQAEIDRLVDETTPYEPVTDRGVQEGDVVDAEIHNEDEPEEKPQRVRIRVGENLPDFDKGILGMLPGEERQIQMTYPDDYADESLRGRTVTLVVKVNGIYSRTLPEITDEWVQKIFSSGEQEGEDTASDKVDSVEKLKSLIRSGLERAAQADADEMVRAEIIRKVVSESKVSFPQAIVDELVESELEELVETLRRRDLTLVDYLRHTNQTPENLRERIAESVRRHVTNALIFREIAKRENITVSDEDVEAEIKEMARERRVPVETMRAYVESTQSKSEVENRVQRKKVLDFLVHASNIKNVSS